MGKVATAQVKPVQAVKKVVSVKAAAANNFDDFVTLSCDAPESDMEIILYGQYGAGKTTAMATASEFFPKSGLPTAKHKGKPKYILEDMFWFSFDRGATAGFAERGIAVPEFSVPRFMGDEKLWRKAGLQSRPNIRQAVEFGLNLAAAAVSRGAKWIAVDTLSSFDAGLEAHGRNNMPKGHSQTGGEVDDTRGMFGQMFYGHKLFHDAMRSLGCGLLYSAHAKDMGDISKLKPEEKKRLLTLTASGMPSFMPQLTGKGAGVYKGDASLQLVIMAKRDPSTKKLRREAYTIMQDDWEAKNRFELSLDPVEKPDLGAMLRKIRS